MLWCRTQSAKSSAEPHPTKLFAWVLRKTWLKPGYFGNNLEIVWWLSYEPEGHSELWRTKTASHFPQIVDVIGCRFRYCAFWSGFFISLCVRFPYLFSILSSPPLPPFLRLPRRLHSVLSWNCCRQLHTLVTCDFIKRRSVEVMNMMQGQWRGEGSTKAEIQPFSSFFPPLLTPVSPANCLLTKSGDRATIFY